METCVLLPREFSLILQPGAPGRALEMGVTLWTNCTLSPGMLFRPDEGEIKLDKLEVYSLLRKSDIRHEYGCTDTIGEVENNEVRHCNWVRFLHHSSNVDKVNVVASRRNGCPIFQVIKTLSPNTELVAYFDESDRDSDDEIDVETVPGELEESLLGREERLKPCSVSPPSSPLPMVEDFVSPSSIKSPTTITSPQSELDSRSTILSPTSSEEYDRTASDVSPKVGAVSPQDVTPNERGSGEKSSPSSWSSFSSPSGSSNPYTPDMTSAKGGDYRTPLHQLPLRRKEKTWLPCEVCGKKFDRPSLLKRHMRTHTGEKPHACDVCGKAFSTSSSLNTHRRIHSGEKPHQCQVCGKRFTASSNLYYHRMTHKKEKPHKCNLCSKSFPTPGDLKSHMYVHNGSWPYKCDICNRGFSKQTNLKNHALLHTGDKPHECPLCGKKFALQCNLKTHIKTHEDEPQERCLQCGNSYLASRHQAYRGLCRECSPRGTALHSSPEDARHPPKPFTIESLVSPERGARLAEVKSASKSSPPQRVSGDLGKSPFYASAMMSAGVLPMPYGGGPGHYGMGMGWPPTPMGQRYGI